MLLAHRHTTPAPGPTTGGRCHDERGSVLILVAICLTVLVTATALTIDLGRISTARRDLQKVADVAALDLSRLLDGRTTTQILGSTGWDDALTRSLDRNGFARTGGRTVVAAIGHWNSRTQVFAETTGAEVPDAVRVEVAEDVDFQFAPGGRRTSRTGVAAQTAAAGFTVGSFAARLDAQRSALLEPLLGDALGVTAVGYTGLAGGQVDLGLLATQLSLGSPSELATATVTLAELIQAEAEVLRAGGDLARAQLLDDLALALPNPQLPVLLGDVVSVATGGEGAAGLADLDALELLTTVAYVANGTNFLDLPDVGLTLPGGLVTTTAKLQVIEKPRFAFGPVGTRARTAQVTLQVTIHADVPGIADTTIELGLSSADAVGTTTAIGCNSPQRLDLDVTTGLVTSRADITAQVSALGLPVADVAMHAVTGSNPTLRTFAFDFPPDTLGTAEQVPTPGLNLGGASVVTDSIDVIGLPLPDEVTGAVDVLSQTVVAPLLTALDDALITPLSDLLGLTLAGVDVTPLSVACSGPQLVG